MRSNDMVTVWHFMDGKDAPEKMLFCGLIENRTEKITKNGIKQKGFYFGGGMSVRIFTKDEIGITTGDYLCKGESESDFYKSSDMQKIIEVRDNRKGANPHWRIFCGG